VAWPINRQGPALAAYMLPENVQQEHIECERAFRFDATPKRLCAFISQGSDRAIAGAFSLERLALLVQTPIMDPVIVDNGKNQFEDHWVLSINSYECFSIPHPGISLDDCFRG
jgi:hypothetical protein